MNHRSYSKFKPSPMEYLPLPKAVASLRPESVNQYQNKINSKQQEYDLKVRELENLKSRTHDQRHDFENFITAIDNAHLYDKADFDIERKLKTTKAMLEDMSTKKVPNKPALNYSSPDRKTVFKLSHFNSELSRKNIQFSSLRHHRSANYTR